MTIAFRALRSAAPLKPAPVTDKTGSSRKVRKAGTTTAGRELVAAVKEMHRALTTGDYSGMTIREVEISSPRHFDAAAVKTLRGELGVSIAVFARLCGVSSKLVEHWEQNRRTPSPLACRLLETIAADPADYLASLTRARRVRARK